MKKYDPRLVYPLLFLGFLLFISLFAGIISPYELGSAKIYDRLCSPSTTHLLGCDLNGGDVLTSLFHGGRLSLSIGIITVLLTLSVGVLIGGISGLWGGWIDIIFMRIVDILLAFPGILLALVISSILGPSMLNIIIAISATGWISSARLVRGQVLSLKEREFVEAARAIGVSRRGILIKHILPLTWPLLIIHATFSLSGVIIIESSLSFLGLSSSTKVTSWGSLLSQGKDVLIEAPHLTLAPGLCIMLTVLALNFLGDSLRDRWDPKTKK